MLSPKTARLGIFASILVSVALIASWLDIFPYSDDLRSLAHQQADSLLGTSTASETYQRFALPEHDSSSEEDEDDEYAPVTSKRPANEVEPILSQTRHGKTIVVGKTANDDVSWITKELPGWDHAIYAVDDSHAALHTDVNKGNEANPFLQFIVDNYDDLPEIMVFLHPHKDNFWHLDTFNNAEVVKYLSLNHVRREGYVPLRCSHEPGCPDVMHPTTAEPAQEQAFVYAQAWPHIFPDRPLPEVVGAPCCSQFAVTREAVLLNRRMDYIRMLDFLRHDGTNNYMLGRAYEYAWHIIFGKDPVFCPEEKKCYKAMWGLDIENTIDGLPVLTVEEEGEFDV